MRYFLFNNDIFVATEKGVERLPKDSRQTFPFSGVKRAHVCVVDVDVLVKVAPEERPVQKDIILSREFTQVYPGDYVIQAERISENKFQIVGVKTEKVREVYKLLPGDKVVTFVPYAMALRSFLSTQHQDSGDIVVFVDDLEGETLITFFDGQEFNPTRRFNESDIEKILPEIKRSATGFIKERREQRGYLILTNNLQWVDLIKRLEPGQKVQHVDSRCPAIEGLKTGRFSLKFELPEEIIRRNQDKERKSKIPYFVSAGTLVFLGLGFVIFYWVSLFIQSSAYERAQQTRNDIESRLLALDPKIYRAALKSQKPINYGDVYLWLANVIPSSYEVNSLVFIPQGKKWHLEILLSLLKGQPYEDIPVKKPYTKMTVQNVLVKDCPGKSIRIEL